MLKNPIEDSIVIFGDTLQYKFSDFDGAVRTMKLRAYGLLDSYTRVRLEMNPETFVAKIEDESLYITREPNHGLIIRHPDDWDELSLGLEWGEKPDGLFLLVSVAEGISFWHTNDQYDHFKKKGLCPRCGDSGYWRNLALNCKYHEQFI